MRYLIVFLTIFAALHGSLASADDRPGLSPRDLVTLERLSDPQVSPDGTHAVFVRRTTDLEADRGGTDLWIVEIGGGGLRQLTAHPASDSSPRFSPDGSFVYFLSARSGAGQVWRLPMRGGEAQQITDLALGVGAFALSPDGVRLAVAVEVFSDCQSLDCSVERYTEREVGAASGQLYDQLFVRHWDTWKDGRRSHLFVLPVSGGGEAVDIMAGMEADVPSKPFGGPEEFTFTPDGRGLVFAARTAGESEPWSTDLDLYWAPIDASESPRCLTGDNEATDTHPVFSPEGATLAYLAMARPGYESDRYRIVLRSWPDGETRVLTDEWDRSAREIVFSDDGRTIYTLAADVGQVSLFAIDVVSGAVRTLVADGRVRSPRWAVDRLLFGHDHLGAPVEFYTVRADASGLEQITDVNGGRLSKIALGEAEQFRFAGWNGETVYGYVVKPAHFDSQKKYPIAFLIHGGPQGSFGNDFHYRWNPQTYAGAGFAVVTVDFHGSTGYGQAFTDSINGDWGGKPLEDLQKGLAAALEAHPWLDGERVCALGASYGGYMVNWIAGNWPERFRCLVNHDGVFDQRMMYYATEELWFPEWEHGGPYWSAAARHEKHNPANHVERWKTPMLVVHGARDYRIPETQGLAAFTALQRRGVPSRLLFFPDENHWVLKPANSIQWHEVVLDWLRRWTAE